MEAEQLRRSLDRYKGLVEVSALITSITDSDELLSAILDVARRGMNAEASSLFIAENDGALRLVIARNAGRDIKTPIIVPRGHGISGWVYENTKTLLVPDAYRDPRFYADADRQSGFTTRSILCAPLVSGERKIGVLQVLNPTDKLAFDEGDLDAFSAYAQLAATAIEKLQTIQRQREQERVAQELSLAHEIQNSFLPQTLPQLENVCFAATYRPASNVGGDFYDVLQIGEDEIYFVIGDVSGKGIPAALLMAQSLSVLRFILQPGISPADALNRWNQMLCGHTIRGMFITAIVGRVVPSQQTVEIACAGHCPPLRVSGRTAVDSDACGSPPIGVIEQLDCKNAAVKIEP